MRYKTSLISLALVLVSFHLHADIFEILGGQKVGTTSLTFLKIGVDTRSEGMGQTLVSTTRSVTGVFFNPANAVLLKDGMAFSHTFWIGDISYDYVGFVKNLGNSAFAIQASSLSSGYIEETDELHPTGTGKHFRFSDNLISVSYAFRITDRFALGVTTKGIMETLADINSYSLALDIGTFYNVGYRNIKIGMSLLNMGSDVRPTGKYSIDGVDYLYEAYPLPIVYRIGTSGMIFKNFLFAVEMDKPSDNVETFKIGCEFTHSNFFAMRVGYRLNSRAPGSSGLSCGVGFIIPWHNRELSLDYAYTEMGLIGGTNRIGVSLGL